MSEMNDPPAPRNDYEQDVAKFLDAVDEPNPDRNSSDLWDCLWRVVPRSEGEVTSSERENWEVLRYELGRLGAASAEVSAIEKELKGTTSIHRSLREGLVELLTDVYFPGGDAWTTQPAPFAEDLLRGLERGYQRGGESPDAARMHAIAVIRDLLRHPERYEEIREMAGLSAGQDSGMEVRSEMSSGVSSGFLAPIFSDENEISSLEQPPIVPEEVYLGGEDAWPKSAIWDRAPRKRPKNAQSLASDEGPLQLPQGAEPPPVDTAHHRNLRYKKND